LFTKQYNLVPAKGRKVTAGLAESNGSRSSRIGILRFFEVAFQKKRKKEYKNFKFQNTYNII